MIPTLNLSRLSVISVALLLSGCITLLPDSKPTQLYRFTPDPQASATPSPTEGRYAVVRAGGNFHPAAAGDRILTSDGAEAAYLANARWTQAAAVLFDQALVRAFATSSGPARLITPGELGRPAFGLRVDVSRFEAAYDRGPRAAPEIRVDLHLVLTRLKDQTVVQEQTFAFSRRATENRGEAIAEAFSEAVEEALETIVRTTDQGVGVPPAA